jgi:hypothetical protein
VGTHGHGEPYERCVEESLNATDPETSGRLKMTPFDLVEIQHLCRESTFSRVGSLTTFDSLTLSLSHTHREGQKILQAERGV